jgi:hypothetical protein
MEFFSTSTFWNRKSDNYHRAVRLHTHAVTITVLVLNSDVSSRVVFGVTRAPEN